MTRVLRIAMFMSAAMLVPASAQTQSPLSPQVEAALRAAQTALAARDFQSARQLLNVPVLATHAEAVERLAQLHLQGLGGPKNEVEGVRLMKRSAELGNPMAMLSAGELIERGVGGPAAPVTAKALFTAASSAGHPHAFGHLGRIQWEGGDETSAMRTFSKGSQLGDQFSTECLALGYAVGKGFGADALLAAFNFSKVQDLEPDEGTPCVELAANAGNPWAQYVLGRWLLKGKTVTPNPQQAVNFLTKAADQNHRRAQLLLAETLDKGGGVPRNAPRAYQLYLAAAQKGDEVARRRVGDMLLAGDGVAANPAEAARWWEMVDYGDHRYRLALLYAEGRGVPVNMARATDIMSIIGSSDKKAHDWLKAKADAGNPHAQLAYGRVVEWGFKDANDRSRAPQLTYDQENAQRADRYRQAFAWYKKAADQGLPEALSKVASVYYFGNGVPQNNAQALQYHRSAAERGSASSMLELARGYEFGFLGLPKNPAQAQEWRNRAGRTNDKYALSSLGERALISAALTSNSYRAGQTHLLGQVQSLYAEAARYYEAAHKAGDEGAALQLGDIYHDTIPGVGNYPLAMRWYLTSIRARGFRDRETNKMTEMYRYGQGVPVDLVKAYFWASIGSRVYGTNAGSVPDQIKKGMTSVQVTSADRLLLDCQLKDYQGCV